jgi:hypothetical protein
MLSNHADQFMLTPMPTRVTTQVAERATHGVEMPAPRPLSTSATRSVLASDAAPATVEETARGTVPWKVLFAGAAITAFLLYTS